MTTTKSEQETVEYAIAFAKRLSPPSIILLEGELGVGKTCFVRGLCEGLGGEPRQVSSPTFVIIKEYEVRDEGRLVHIDAYRLSSEEDLEAIGWDELLDDKNAIVAIEWPSRIMQAIPKSAKAVEMQHIDQHTREIVEKRDYFSS